MAIFEELYILQNAHENMDKSSKPFDPLEIGGEECDFSECLFSGV